MNKIALGLVLASSVALTACSTVEPETASTAATVEKSKMMDNDNIQTGSRLPSHAHSVTSTSGADYKNATQGQAAPVTLGR